jgi:hypothetical protein
MKHNCYAKHPDFDDKLSGLFANDGVNLSFIGCDLFINTLQGALETFITKPCCHVYPIQWENYHRCAICHVILLSNFGVVNTCT